MMDAYEMQVTEAVAQTFGFDVVKNEDGSPRFVRCRVCLKRMRFDYYGRGINERMIDHARRHGVA